MLSAVYPGVHGLRMLNELSRSYLTDGFRLASSLKAMRQQSNTS
jgi:hypothetical protein